MPESLQPVTVRHAIRIVHGRFKADCEGLIKSIRQAFEKIEAKRLEDQKAAEVEAARRKTEAEASEQVAAQEEREKRRREAIAGLSPEEIAKAEELANWNFIQDSNSEEEYRDHLARFEGGATSRYARAKLEALAWAKLQSNVSVAALQAYIAEFPKGTHVLEATMKLRSFEEAAKAKKDAEAKRRQETEEWVRLASSYDTDAIVAFLERWPKGQHASAAQARIRELELARKILPSTHPEEWFSIFFALMASIGGSIFIGYYPYYVPADYGGSVAWAVSVWLGLFYFIIQMTFLLYSVSQFRVIGVLDSVLALAPVVSGLVLLVQAILSPTFKLSSYQLNTLGVLIVAGASEFLLTIWIRFVLNRRVIGFEADTQKGSSASASPFPRWG